MSGRDDTAAIQGLLDGGGQRIYLPPREDGYVISAPLRIHSGQSLSLDRFTVIRLAAGSNCRMLHNADFDAGNADIEICGGIWDMNNRQQALNPLHTPFPLRETEKGLGYNSNYLGTALQFFHVTNLLVHDLTVKDPVTFAIQAARICQADFMHIRFDFNHGHPHPVNMDGVHLDGDCRFVHISDLKGDCYDDMVALNADDAYCGPIEDVTVEGLYVREGHSAVRLLSAGSPVRRVHISRIYGAFYQYAIAFSKYFNEDNGEMRPGAVDEGQFADIALCGCWIAKAPRYSCYQKDGTFVYPLIWMENHVRVSGLHIRDVFRTEEVEPVETIGLDPLAVVSDLLLDGIRQENHTGRPMPLLRNQGKIDQLWMRALLTGEDFVLTGEGTVKQKEAIL